MDQTFFLFLLNDKYDFRFWNLAIFKCNMLPQKLFHHTKQLHLMYAILYEWKYMPGFSWMKEKLDFFCYFTIIARQNFNRKMIMFHFNFFPWFFKLMNFFFYRWLNLWRHFLIGSFLKKSAKSHQVEKLRGAVILCNFLKRASWKHLPMYIHQATFKTPSFTKTINIGWNNWSIFFFLYDFN